MGSKFLMGQLMHDGLVDAFIAMNNTLLQIPAEYHHTWTHIDYGGNILKNGQFSWASRPTLKIYVKPKKYPLPIWLID